MSIWDDETVRQVYRDANSQLSRRSPLADLFVDASPKGAQVSDEGAELLAWLREEVRALSGEYTNQPMRLPPVVRAWMLGCLDVDGACRQVDAQRAQLHRQLGVI
jgi:hypothetical protein